MQFADNAGPDQPARFYCLYTGAMQEILKVCHGGDYEIRQVVVKRPSEG